MVIYFLRLASPLIMPSSCSNWKIYVFLCFPLVTNWKYLLCASLFKRFFTFALWYHLNSSSLRRWGNLPFKAYFKFSSSSTSCVNSAFLSNSSNLSSSCFFSFLLAPLMFLAHPLKYWWRHLILAYHWSRGCLLHVLQSIYP